MKKRIAAILMVVALLLSILTGCESVDTGSSLSSEESGIQQSESVDREADSSGQQSVSSEEESSENLLDPDGTYTSKEDVALYLETYDELPDNFITKKEAKSLGWTGGSLEPYAPGCCIGGDYFGNYEGNLPESAEYHECDINTLRAKSRGAERLVFAEQNGEVSVIYYTNDHYNTFEKIYEE